MIVFFFFNDTATTEIYTLSLHDALPIFAPERQLLFDHGLRIAERVALGISGRGIGTVNCRQQCFQANVQPCQAFSLDRKSTRLNSSHSQISYAVFCLKKQSRRSPTRPVR